MRISKIIITLFGLFHIALVFAAENCHFQEIKEVADKNGVKVYVLGQLMGDTKCKNFKVSDYLSKFDLKKIDSLWIYASKGISLDYELANGNVTKHESSPWIEGLNNRTLRATLNM